MVGLGFIDFQLNGLHAEAPLVGKSVTSIGRFGLEGIIACRERAGLQLVGIGRFVQRKGIIVAGAIADHQGHIRVIDEFVVVVVQLRTKAKRLIFVEDNFGQVHPEFPLVCFYAQELGRLLDKFPENILVFML